MFSNSIGKTVVVLLWLQRMSVGRVIPPLPDNHELLEPQRRSEDWPVNVAFTTGTQTLGFELPRNGQVHDLGSIECLALPSYSIGDCNDISVSQIGVTSGTAPCTFMGIDGFQITITANDKGYIDVTPPQSIVYGSCG
ncbi:hypothetical protein B0A52_05655 [Exophiala mesophila]|uniref:Uncharacterized protein n=1 Tax=Exophiala mesophila TaxID=212818 RepID=A0A0D1WGT8_EXOME|nr:uncharacterized protein PV10_09165 [Exophiala mesophila]KIV87980.1 hypothetical protein PV10_09165 [Exophiala mesophila]RVX70322.1 hypothetical protein B0A52_05655 [Exophiala mesophila]